MKLQRRYIAKLGTTYRRVEVAAPDVRVDVALPDVRVDVAEPEVRVDVAELLVRELLLLRVEVLPLLPEERVLLLPLCVVEGVRLVLVVPDECTRVVVVALPARVDVCCCVAVVVRVEAGCCAAVVVRVDVAVFCCVAAGCTRCEVVVADVERVEVVVRVALPVCDCVWRVAVPCVCVSVVRVPVVVREVVVVVDRVPVAERDVVVVVVREAPDCSTACCSCRAFVTRVAVVLPCGT